MKDWKLREDFDSIANRIDSIEEALRENQMIHFCWGGAYYPKPIVVVLKGRLTHIEQKLDMVLEHLGLEYKKVPASDEHYIIQTKEK